MRFHFRKDGKLYRVNTGLSFKICFAYQAGIEFDSYEEARDVLYPELEDIYEEVPEPLVRHSWVNVSDETKSTKI